MKLQSLQHINFIGTTKRSKVHTKKTKQQIELKKATLKSIQYNHHNKIRENFQVSPIHLSRKSEPLINLNFF
jgi:hypothetical protein